ncbi:MAG: ATP-binding protein [Phycisphaerae bacterium]|jgi:signal transduction histidine kinase
MRLTLKTKFLLYVSTLIVCAMSITTLVTYTNSRKAIHRVIAKQLTQLVVSTATSIDLWMNDRKTDFINWGQLAIYKTALEDSIFSGTAREDSNLRLKEMKRNCPYYESLNLANINGQIVCSSSEKVIGKIDVRNQLFFNESLQKSIYISSIMKSPETQRDVFVISAPIEQDNAVTGVIYGIIDMDVFNNLFIMPINVCKTGYAYLIDSDGFVIVYSNKECAAGENIKSYDFGKKIMQTRSGSLAYSRQEIEKIVFFEELKNSGWLLAAGAETREIFAPVKDLCINNVAITLLFIAIAIVSVTAIYKCTILTPINCLIKGISKFGDGEFDTKIELKTRDEFSSLADSFNKMAEDIQKTTTSIDNLNREIDERKKAEEEMIKLNQNLQEANQEMKNFVYIASHDLREPLRKITSFGAMLEKSLKNNLSGDDSENLKFMVDGAQRLNKMIEGLLVYSRVSSKTQPPQLIDLNEIMKQLQQIELSEVLRESQVILEIPQSLPFVEADPAQMRQLIQNLIANGIKYQKKDNRPHITITSKPAANGMVRIEVTDNGIGIKPEYQSAIFVMFKRLHTRSEYEGTGIGLAVCKKIAERHGGQIGVESGPDKGSTFWFTVPMANCNCPASISCLT